MTVNFKIHALKWLISAIFVLIQLLLFAQGSRTHAVYFSSDSYNLSTTEIERMNSFLSLFDPSKITSVLIQGHTDSDGDFLYNDRLSENRSNTVKNKIDERLKVPISLGFFGEKKPLNQNTTHEDKAANRRVEIVVTYGPGGLWSEKQVENYKVLGEHNLEITVYCINPSRDTTLILAKGGKVTFLANTFPSDGKCVTISSKEAYKRSEMILANLTTRSNNQLLESGGMVFLEAKNSAGKILDAKKEFQVQMPTNNFLDSMQIFNGTEGHDGLNWNLTSFNSNQRLFPGTELDYCFEPSGQLRPLPPSCERCRFFCRLNRVGASLKGTRDVELKKENKAFRACQKSLRKRGRKKVNPNQNLAAIQNELCDETNRIMDSLGLETYEQYLAYLNEKRRIEFEENLKVGKVNVNELTYYSMQSSQMGWINCDRFVAMPENQKIVASILLDEDEPELQNTQVNIILEDKTSLIGSARSGRKFNFISLPAKMGVFILAVMMKNGRIFMSLQKSEISERMPDPVFKEVSYEELQLALKELD